MNKYIYIEKQDKMIHGSTYYKNLIETLHVLIKTKVLANNDLIIKFDVEIVNYMIFKENFVSKEILEFKAKEILFLMLNDSNIDLKCTALKIFTHIGNSVNHELEIINEQYYLDIVIESLDILNEQITYVNDYKFLSKLYEGFKESSE